jgi:integrase
MISTVSLRQSNRKNGKGYLFLDYHPPIKNQMTGKTYRQEYLHLSVYLNPSDRIQKEHNEKTLRQAEAIRSMKALEVINKHYGMYDSDSEKKDFLIYYKNTAGIEDSSYLHFHRFCKGRCRFGDITIFLCNQFRDYLLTKAKKKDGNVLSNNSASSYYGRFLFILKQAYKEKLIPNNITDSLDKIPYRNPQRPYLIMDEILSLNNTPCRYAVLKRASMFAIFTGLRISDILNLDWSDIKTAPDGGPCIIKNIVKTNREDIIFISEEALEYCGTRKESGPVFYGLTKSMTHDPLKQWLKDAGITKDFSFHCFRHTYATMLMAYGTDIYTVSHQLTHRNVRTTQIYADLVDDKRRMAANAITIKTKK